MDLVVVAAFALLVLGVVGSIAPIIPGGLLSLAGVVLFWWHTGEPGPILLGVLVVTGILAVLVDWVAGAVGAKAGGASLWTSAIATIVGIVLFFVAGPVGLILGIGGTVFAVEFYGGATRDEGLRAAGYAVVGVLSSALVQGLLTSAILVAIVIVYL